MKFGSLRLSSIYSDNISVERKVCLVINEFAPGTAPVGTMAGDLSDYLDLNSDFQVRNMWVEEKYVPGGLKVKRIWNIFNLLYKVTVQLLILRLIKSFKNLSIFAVVVTTPPLFHWYIALLSKILDFKVVVWYQDAFPDILFNRFRMPSFLVSLLRKIDESIITYASSFITLDQSMERSLRNKSNKYLNVTVAAPWVGYLGNGVPMRYPFKGSGVYKLVYAGNYGEVHDLYPLSNLLKDCDRIDIKVEVSFVGMKPETYENLKSMFNDIKCTYHERFDSTDDLSLFMSRFDYGIVALSERYLGLSCPSKALSYLSLGIPFIYVGPEGTFAENLAKNGWGRTIDDLKSDGLKCLNQHSGDRVGEVFENPSLSSKEEVCNLLSNTI